MEVCALVGDANRKLILHSIHFFLYNLFCNTGIFSQNEYIQSKEKGPSVPTH